MIEDLAKQVKSQKDAIDAEKQKVLDERMRVLQEKEDLHKGMDAMR